MNKFNLVLLSIPFIPLLIIGSIVSFIAYGENPFKAFKSFYTDEYLFSEEVKS